MKHIDLDKTQKLPLYDPAMPATPKPRRVDETAADPTWIAVMDALNRQSCLLEDES